MLSIVQKFKGQYKKASKTSKSRITDQVLKQIQEVDGKTSPKFLKPVGGDKGGPWYQLTEKEARLKIAHTLREHKKIVKSSTGAIKATKPKRKRKAPKDTPERKVGLATRLTTLNTSSASTVSDDEEEPSHRAANRNNDNGSDSESSSDGEPLSFKEEPIFIEEDIEMLHTVLDDDDDDEAQLGSFLGDLEL